MALLTATRPTAPGVAWTPTAVSASDTISASDLGQLGAYLVIINGNASVDNVVVSDSSTTPAGNPAAAPTNVVTNGTSEVQYISPKAVNPSTNVVTVTHSVTPSVTCVLLPLG
jgi:hypothetical protein